MTDEEVLACTLYGEARGEYALLNGGIASLIAVGNVVLNRVKAKTWFGKTVAEVCQKPFQFSCWNKGDHNFKIIQGIVRSDPLFERCFFIAQNLNQCPPQWPDLTQGATHYYALGEGFKPSWASSLTPTFQIGKHLFLR